MTLILIKPLGHTETIPSVSRPSDPKVKVIRKQLNCHAIKKEKKRSLEWWR